MFCFPSSNSSASQSNAPHPQSSRTLMSNASSHFVSKLKNSSSFSGKKPSSDNCKENNFASRQFISDVNQVVQSVPNNAYCGLRGSSTPYVHTNFDRKPTGSFTNGQNNGSGSFRLVNSSNNNNINNNTYNRHLSSSVCNSNNTFAAQCFSSKSFTHESNSQLLPPREKRNPESLSSADIDQILASGTNFGYTRHPQTPPTQTAQPRPPPLQQQNFVSQQSQLQQQQRLQRSPSFSPSSSPHLNVGDVTPRRSSLSPVISKPQYGKTPDLNSPSSSSSSLFSSCLQKKVTTLSPFSPSYTSSANVINSPTATATSIRAQSKPLQPRNSGIFSSAADVETLARSASRPLVSYASSSSTVVAQKLISSDISFDERSNSIGSGSRRTSNASSNSSNCGAISCALAATASSVHEKKSSCQSSSCCSTQTEVDGIVDCRSNSPRAVAYASTENGLLQPICPQCRTNFSDEGVLAYNLDCHHTFCEKCLDDLCAAGTVICPHCGAQTLLPAGGNFRSLRRNYALNSLTRVSMVNLKKNLSGAVMEELGATCPVCLEGYLKEVPRMLSCGHTICDSCVCDLMFKHGTENHQFECPQCRQVNEFPALPLNVALQKIVGVVVVAKEQQDQLQKSSLLS